MALPWHSILRLYVSCSFEAFQFYEIAELIFVPHVQHLPSTNYDFPYHSVKLSIHAIRVYCDPVKGTPPPSFFRFSDLENGKSDRAEIFITDRLPEKMRHVFEEKIW